MNPNDEVIYGTFSNADVDALETIAEIRCRGAELLHIVFTVAVADLTNFNVDSKITQEAPYVTVANAAGSFTTPVFPVLAASGDLNVAAVGTHWLILDVRGIDTVRLQAAGANTTIAGHWSAK